LSSPHRSSWPFASTNQTSSEQSCHRPCQHSADLEVVRVDQLKLDATNIHREVFNEVGNSVAFLACQLRPFTALICVFLKTIQIRVCQEVCQLLYLRRGDRTGLQLVCCLSRKLSTNEFPLFVRICPNRSRHATIPIDLSIRR